MALEVTVKSDNSRAVRVTLKLAKRLSRLQQLRVIQNITGDIKLNVAAKDINCSIGGSGEIHLEGSGDGLAISIGGSGDIEAYDLSVRKCEISSAGSGDINVNVSEKLDVSMVGSGDVSYKGDPKISKSIVGSGDVERAGSK